MNRFAICASVMLLALAGSQAAMARGPGGGGGGGAMGGSSGGSAMKQQGSTGLQAQQQTQERAGKMSQHQHQHQVGEGGQKPVAEPPYQNREQSRHQERINQQ